MSILEITKKESCNGNPCINELDYGTFVTDVPSGKNCIYIKVKKKGKSEGRCYSSKKALSIQWQSGYCILLNITYGTLRQVPENTIVTPLKPNLTVSPVPHHLLQEVLAERYK